MEEDVVELSEGEFLLEIVCWFLKKRIKGKQCGDSFSTIGEKPAKWIQWLQKTA